MIAERLDHAGVGALTIAAEDPRAPDSIALFDEMSAFVLATYPEDEENGIVPTSTDELARQGVLLIARVGGVAAGSGALMSHAPVDGLRVMEVKRMLVRPAFRGRGVAERILGGLEDIASARGLQKLVLMCGPRQPAALKLYEKAGYSLRGPYGKWEAHPLSIFMEKRLEANHVA
ncbi:MAG TPA: GNAT family N-acetyltransferase [Hyphomonadaceae bacterium]|jgi:putative acetyltransferase|nr:GNAT family N-acetyltransferase [Hyphomonadaceae bacterium]